VGLFKVVFSWLDAVTHEGRFLDSRDNPLREGVAFDAAREGQRRRLRVL